MDCEPHAQELSESPFPRGEEALRSFLLDSVGSIAEVISQSAEISEGTRTLAPKAAEALRTSGLTAMKSPRSAGGAEAHPTIQMDVIEAVTKLDPAAGWSLLVASGIAARVLSALPDDAARELLGSESFPLFAGSLKPTGSARRVDGGLEVSGRWAWASGVRHADYAVAPAFFEDQPGVAWVVAPLNTVEIHDAWFSLGLKGTGSTEFSLDKAFIPQRFASLTGKPVRGGALYRLGYGSAAHEHGIFAYALGRAALDAAVAAAEEKVRGYAVGKGIAHREIFQSAVAEGELRLRSSRLLMADTATRLFDSAVEAEAPIALQAEARAASAFCTNEAIEVTTQIFRILGGDSVMQGSPMERIWRDLMTAQAHLFVSQSSYEALGRLRLGLSEEAPLG